MSEETPEKKTSKLGKVGRIVLIFVLLALAGAIGRPIGRWLERKTDPFGVHSHHRHSSAFSASDWS